MQERIKNFAQTFIFSEFNLLARYQSGFRAGHNTNDNLVRLKIFIRDVFAEKEHVVAVFFDLEKAY